MAEVNPFESLQEQVDDAAAYLDVAPDVVDVIGLGRRLHRLGLWRHGGLVCGPLQRGGESGIEVARGRQPRRIGCLLGIVGDLGDFGVGRGRVVAMAPFRSVCAGQARNSRKQGVRSPNTYRRQAAPQIRSACSHRMGRSFPHVVGPEGGSTEDLVPRFPTQTYIRRTTVYAVPRATL